MKPDQKHQRFPWYRNGWCIYCKSSLKGTAQSHLLRHETRQVHILSSTNVRGASLMPGFSNKPYMQANLQTPSTISKVPHTFPSEVLLNHNHLPNVLRTFSPKIVPADRPPNLSLGLSQPTSPFDSQNTSPGPPPSNSHEVSANISPHISQNLLLENIRQFPRQVSQDPSPDTFSNLSPPQGHDLSSDNSSNCPIDVFTNFVDDISSKSAHTPLPKGDWAPYRSKLHYLGAVLLFNVLRPISKERCKQLWRWLKLMDIQMPSVESIVKEQTRIANTLQSTSLQYKSAIGTQYHFANIEGILKMELANPYISNQLRRMPEIHSNGTAEHYHCRRWLEDEDMQAPCVEVGGVLFYTREYYRHHSTGIHFRIMQFATRDGEESFLWTEVVKVQAGQYAIDLRLPCHWSPCTELFNAKRKNPTITSILRPGGNIDIDNIDQYKQTENPYRKHGRKVVIIPLLLQADDMAGGRTKKWSAHYSWWVHAQFNWNQQ